MNALFSSRSSSTSCADGDNNGNTPATSAEAPTSTQETAGTPDSTADTPSPAPASDVPKRPLLIRNQLSQPAPLPPAAPTIPAPPLPGSTENAPGLPPSQVHAPTVQNEQQRPTDSLSLAQLRRFVAEFPRGEALAYDYTYTDMGPIEEEIDEWFQYNFWQWVRLNAANRAFATAWGKISPASSWEDSEPAARRQMVETLLEGIKDKEDRIARNEAIGAAVYLVLGRWTETVTVRRVGMLNGVAEGKVKHAATKVQLDAMREGVKILGGCGGIEVVWDALREAFEPFWVDDAAGVQQQNMQMAGEELIHLMTVLYVVIQEGLETSEEVEEEMEVVRERLRKSFFFFFSLPSDLFASCTSCQFEWRILTVCVFDRFIKPQSSALFDAGCVQAEMGRERGSSADSGMRLHAFELGDAAG